MLCELLNLIKFIYFFHLFIAKPGWGEKVFKLTSIKFNISKRLHSPDKADRHLINVFLLNNMTMICLLHKTKNRAILSTFTVFLRNHDLGQEIKLWINSFFVWLYHLLYSWSSQRNCIYQCFLFLPAKTLYYTLYTLLLPKWNACTYFFFNSFFVLAVFQWKTELNLKQTKKKHNYVQNEF